MLERVNNGFLEFDLGAPSRADCASIWNGNVAVDIYGLGRDANKIAGAHTRLGRDEESPRTRLKNCHAEEDADTEAEIARPAPIRKFADRPRRRLGHAAGDSAR